MTAQRHIIKRQVIELHVGRTANAQDLQAEVSRIYRQRLVPLIERYCSELSAPERIHRIAALELNLGALDPQHLEDDLVTKVRSQLRAVLAHQIATDERRAESTGLNRTTASFLELCSVFAQTGSMPWWTDTSRPHLLDDCVHYLIHHAPDPLRQLLQELVQDPRCVQRLVYHLADGLLTDLLAVLVPSRAWQDLSAVMRDLFWVVSRTKKGAAQQHIRLRHLVWGIILQQASLQGTHHTAWPPLLQAVLRRVAADLGVDYGAFLADIQQVMQQEHDRLQSPGGEIAAMLYTELPHLPPSRVQEGLDEGVQPWTSLLPRLRALAAPLPAPQQAPLLAAVDHVVRHPWEPATMSTLFAVLRSSLLLQHLSSRLVPHWLAALEQILQDGVTPERVHALTTIVQAALQELPLPPTGAERPEPNDRRESEETLPWSRLVSLLRALAMQLPASNQAPLLAAVDGLDERLADPRALLALLPMLRALPLPPLRARWQGALEQLVRAGVTPEGMQALTVLFQERLQELHSPQRRQAAGRPVPPTTPLDLTFSAADALYVDNAGLVILHPFLRHFFDRLGLLDERQFKDGVSRQRAVGLLQYVVCEDSSPPEYFVALNKTLCGMEFDAVFDFGPPVTEAEAEECTNLLTAVIANAPILRNMSLNGLRSTFLLRQGVLSSRDGAWLLRVERATYDVVLDRFPWTMQWVKLPWMDTPLRVEW